MSDIDVTANELRSAAKAAGSLSGELDGVQLSSVSQIGSALPGANLDGKASACGKTLDDATRKISHGIDNYGQALSSAADSYDSGEREKADGFRAGG